MIIFPAIDLYEGKAVRLLKGDYRNMTVYSDDPLAVARDFERQGATYVHLVDLEGARDGTTPNSGLVARIAQQTALFTEIGGGIRTMETVERYFSLGVDRVILGTAAVDDPAFLQTAVTRYGDRIAVGADVQDGCIAVKGWLERSPVTLQAFLQRLQRLGVSHVICTDISRDGAMRGTNLALYRELSESCQIAVTASGGVSTLADVAALRRMELYGAIVGKAYYTGAIDLRQAIEVAK